MFVAMGKPLSSETAARASIAQLASQKEENIRELLGDKKVFLIVDVAEVDKQKFINVLVGSLDTRNEAFVIECLLESSSYVNSSIILRSVDDVLRQLGTERLKRENFALFLTDAAWYMSLAGKTLTELYPTLMHVNGIAHLLHNCMRYASLYFL